MTVSMHTAHLQPALQHLYTYLATESTTEPISCMYATFPHLPTARITMHGPNKGVVLTYLPAYILIYDYT